MEVKSLKELAKLADICRKKGIKQIKFTQDCVEFVLGDRAPTKLRSIKGDKEEPKLENEEDIIFWSAQGVQ